MESASALDSFNGTVTGASSGRGEGRKIKHTLLARERVEQADDFGGRVKAESGSYFDDVLRDSRRYGIENTTDKCSGRALLDNATCAPSVLSAIRKQST